MHNYTGPHDYFNDDYVDEWASVANSKHPFRHVLVSTGTFGFVEASVAKRNSLREPRPYKLRNRAVQIVDYRGTFRAFVEADCFEGQQVQPATIRLIYFVKER